MSYNKVNHYNVDIDHAYWGRAHEQKTKRPIHVYHKGMGASDLMGKVASALAAASILFQKYDCKFSSQILEHAKEIYDLGKENKGAL